MIKKILLILMGLIATGIGIIGIFLPLLPTTPLLLLAAYCFIRSSSRMYKWLIHHKTLGPYVYNYIELRAVTKNTKIIAISSMWFSLLITMVIIQKVYVRYIIIIIGVAVTIYILSLNSVDKMRRENMNR